MAWHKMGTKKWKTYTLNVPFAARAHGKRNCWLTKPTVDCISFIYITVRNLFSVFKPELHYLRCCRERWYFLICLAQWGTRDRRAMWGIDTSSGTARNSRFQQHKNKIKPSWEQKHYTTVNPFKKTDHGLKKIKNTLFTTPIVNIVNK